MFQPSILLIARIAEIDPQFEFFGNYQFWQLIAARKLAATRGDLNR
jgi:hypothetical protein